MALSVAVFIYDHSTSGVAYSGGRYHALLIAYAMAHHGARVSVVVNDYPASCADLQNITDRPVEYILSNDFVPADVVRDFDYVFVAPTGAFYPAFYSCAEQVTSRCNATPVLINYESGNWFNRLVPTPDFPEVWDYWQRVVVRGGIVLSSTVESDRFARDFYQADNEALHFEQCYPPINSVVADQVATGDNDGSIVYFARPYHDHKGGGDVLALPTEVFAGRIFRAVFGGNVDGRFLEAPKTKIGEAPDATLLVYSEIDDYEKYALIARASAVLFPSRFEGFGYPAVEAAYVGTEVVSYELPVLVETVGEIAHMAPIGDTEALAQALMKALAKPSRSALLCSTVADKVAFDQAGANLLEILERWHGTALTSAPTSRFTVLWGPWRTDDIDDKWPGEADGQ